MKRKAKTMTVIAMLTMLVPGWLYASGNLPPVFPQNERIIRAINDSWPDLAEVTFQNAHRAFQKLRDAGIEVPYTYNERLLRISRIKKQVVTICNSIITDS